MVVDRREIEGEELIDPTRISPDNPMGLLDAKMTRLGFKCAQQQSTEESRIWCNTSASVVGVTGENLDKGEALKFILIYFVHALLGFGN